MPHPAARRTVIGARCRPRRGSSSAELRAAADAGAIVIVVSHRPAVIAAADAVITARGGGPCLTAAGVSTAARDVLRLAQPPARRFVPGVLVGALGAGSAVALLATSAWLIARAAEQPSIVYISLAVVGVRAFAISRGAFRYLERLVTHDAALRQLTRLRVQLLERLVPLAPDGMNAIGRGDLLTRFSRDVDELQNLPLRVLQPALVAGVTAARRAWSSCGSSARRRPVALAGCLVVAFVAGTLLHAAVVGPGGCRRRSAAAAPSARRWSTCSRASTHSSPTAPSTRACNGWLAADAALRRAETRAAAGAGLSSAVALALGRRRDVGRHHHRGAGTALGIARRSGTRRHRARAAGGVRGLRHAPGGGRRLAPGARQRRASGIRGSRRRSGRAAVSIARATRVRWRQAVAAHCTLTGLTARWPDGGGAIGPLDLAVRPGERLLVRGESGAGKTTLAHVLVRLLDYDGSFRVGDDEVRELQQDGIRTLIGLCEQQPWIFDATLRDNLVFARETATDAELRAVLARVGLAEWAASRDGLDTALGEHGSRVSGGQAQRIALARALLRGLSGARARRADGQRRRRSGRRRAARPARSGVDGWSHRHPHLPRRGAGRSRRPHDHARRRPHRPDGAGSTGRCATDENIHTRALPIGDRFDG